MKKLSYYKQRNDENIKALVGDKQIVKVIGIPKKLINIVVK